MFCAITLREHISEVRCWPRKYYSHNLVQLFDCPDPKRLALNSQLFPQSSCSDRNFPQSDSLKILWRNSVILSPGKCLTFLSSLSLTYSVASQEYVVCRATCPVELVLSEELYDFRLFLLSKAVISCDLKSEQDGLHIFIIIFMSFIFSMEAEKHCYIQSYG